MGNIFNMDNKFFQFMGRIADLILLNLLCIICCIPIITAGASITAMYYQTMKMVKNEDSYIIRGFFHSFKQNFRQSIAFNLIMLVVAILLYLDFAIVNSMEASYAKVLQFVFVMMSVFYLMIYVYLYPLLAKFYNTVKNTFNNAFRMAIRHFPYTLLMMILTVVPMAIFFIPSAQVQSTVLMLFFLFGFSGIAYVKSIFLVKIFANYIPEEKEDNADRFEELSAQTDSAESIEASAVSEDADASSDHTQD